ncbi:MAG: TolC family protein [Bacteroidetes bacterium]|nr:TolC family protein [Bacteroidota bacterium]MDA1268057.1 TolC family protein [Bacteroidota bacterium]
MKKYLLLLALVGISVFPSAAQQLVELRLSEALTYALENNASAKNARLELLISKATIRETTSQGLPQINGSYNLDYNPKIPVVFLPNKPPFGNPSIPGDVIPARFGVSYSSGLGVSISQMIFDGSFFVGLRAAQTLFDLTNKNLKKTENDVVENVKKAYFGVLVNQQRIRLAEANLSRIDTLLKETTALYESGFVEKVDVSRVQVQRNNTYTQVQRSFTAMDISTQILKLQMGMPMEYEIVLAESLQGLSMKEEMLELLGEEGTDRVELEQVSTQLALTGLDLKNNQYQYMPKINFIGNARRSGAGNELNTVFSNENWFGSSLLGLSMSVPIFDGFSKTARIQKNRVQINQLENQRSFLKESFQNELYSAKANLRNDLSILDVQQSNLLLATEVYQIARIKYKEGVGSNLEVVEADAALIQAEINYLGAIYDGLISKINLEKALGLLKPDLTN